MTKIEVEHRASLTGKKFKELSSFLKKNGKFIERKNRFSIIYLSPGKENFSFINSKIDLRLRITNKNIMKISMEVIII